LSGAGPFTVFAPTDAAFAALPAGTVEALLADPTGDLAQILLYHVASGSVMSTDLSDGQIVTTLQGQTVTITITGGNVFVNDAQVIVADIEAENGVVHVIDAVLLPTINVEETSALELSIYPNPATEQLNIQLPLSGAKAQLTIYNHVGQIVFTDYISTGIQQVNVAPLTQGYYTVEVELEGRVSRTQFLKN
jgi:hypothetical protein